LFGQYSPGNICLIKCENCKSVADEYIECEFMILLIDLILHKPKAYRHLLYNVLHQDTLDVEMLVDVFFGNFLVFCMFSLSTKNLLNTSIGVSR
ncbi:Arv1 domain-containing protein, partial [Cephalotus follicularis]